MPMRSELAAPGARLASQITPNGYARSQIVEALQSPDVLVVLFFSVIGLIIAVLLMALFPFSVRVHRQDL